MSNQTNLDSVLSRALELADGYPSEIFVNGAIAELAALRARVAELERPRACETCIYFDWLNNNGDWWCKSRKTPVIKSKRITPDEFGCIHHEAAQ